MADFNKMLCHSPGGNSAHLYYKESYLDTDGVTTIAAKRLCRRMTLSGWENFWFDSATTAQVQMMGEDDSSYGSSAQTLTIDLSNVSCWNGAANTGLSLGNFEEEIGMCISNKVTTAYIQYNNPTFTGISGYFSLSTNNGLDMIYILHEGGESCLTQAQQDSTQCVATLEYGYYDSRYPEMSFKCVCGTTTTKYGYSQNGTALKVIGKLTTRYIDDDYYKTIDVDPVYY